MGHGVVHTVLSRTPGAEEILDAARRVFLRADFATTSMGEIADEAGVTRGLLNHYFGTKRDLYLARRRRRRRDAARDGRHRPSATCRSRRWSTATARTSSTRWSATPSCGRCSSGPRPIGRDPEVAAVMAAAREEVVERMARNHAGDAVTDELRMALRVFQGAAERAAQEWLARGRMNREQTNAILTGLLLTLVRDVAPSIPRGA